MSEQGDKQVNSVATVRIIGMDKPFFTALAVCLSILAVLIAAGGEWRRWVAFDVAVADLKTKQHDYYEEINVWETDNFNREKDIDSWAKTNLGVDFVQLFGKPKPPPVPK